MRLIDSDRLCEDLLTRWEIADKQKEKLIIAVLADVVAPIIAGQPTVAQPEIIRCKDCKWGTQDEVGRWFCRGLGCQIGSEDGSGYCADAERRTDGSD